MSFSQGLSGLNAASQALDVVGNNIANSQTVGFKSGSIAFADVFAGGQIGMGVQVAGVNQDFSGGAIGMGNSALDMAIDGDGFFRLVNEGGKVFYSRNGQFKQDQDGYIINNQGMYLTGYQATGTPPTIEQGAAIGPIQIPKDQMLPQTSTTGTMKGNLDSGSEIITKTPFDHTDNDTYNSVQQVDAYDSLGNKHTINVYYVKTGENEWTAYSMDTTAPKMDDSTPPKPMYDEIELKFNSSGVLESPADPTLVVNSAEYNGAESLKVNLNLSGTTQLASDTAMNNPSTNGYGAGQMNGYQIEDSGEVVVSYSNGQRQTVGQVLLSNFTNPGGLSPEGNNCWSETIASGQPVTGVSGTGNLGKLYGYKLEASNVDMGNEMINMIVFQRNYQSNSQTIRTQSEILQTLVNIS